MPKKQEPKQQQIEDKQGESEGTGEIEVPSSVVDISKQNTYPNPAQNEPELKPSPLAEELIKTSNVEIENPTLIRMLNESEINTSKLSIGYHARIYLGNWALKYESGKTSVNWEYKQVNKNVLDNRGNSSVTKLTYNQEKKEKVTGGLTAKIADEGEVQKLMIMKAAEKTSLPLGFSTYVGRGTKIDRVYNVEPKKLGYLNGFVPAVNEKGKVTFGEVYLVLKGGKKSIEVKNITQQGIGAWIPIQDHISLRYYVTK
ncbi:YfkD family protein [Pullulanibacillus sp. KACC 23026]|uniref:YfkD family protein n=1 Tax=Pullulanibacillus sp. KACC 23026 TaxID=3028315 RepID=UPI0023AEA9E4|nr:YfkD family protein [Pullulanibacillus sp. KACC 23026]WEG15045.1 YfkD family protein [Pullulanibacillus sp. KACC 23026]